MTYATLTPPQAEPLTLAQVKEHLRLDGSDEDALLLSLIKTARDHLERQTGLCLTQQSFRLYLDAWPDGDVIQIAKGPVQAIEKILVFDDAGDPIDISGIDRMLDGEARPARLWLRQPPLPGQPLNGIEIDFTAGFGQSGVDVPDTLKRAMLIHIAHMFAFRGAVSPADQPAGVPAGYDRLIGPFRRTGL